ncbi:allantoinase AllB [Acuticoccus mangrovi]|uniref:allantoinase n=1 Tax=Acuticoccus mangrovi TaxID=2796142 RepID=A0A934ITX6_9HYPH|nr:allantoinase AllB [Acuticoccus mangrovi]MBJ3778538.1 allantoinase AllB [Acuticoccus mangrovi]
MIDMTIRGGTIVSEEGRMRADVAVHEGRIVAVGESAAMPDARETIDAEGLLVLPGVIDIHVHFRDPPGDNPAEDWQSGTAAAAAGGVTTIFEMPSTDPATDTVAHLEVKRRIAEAKSHVDYGIYGLLGRDNLADLPALAEAGVAGFKCFMSSSITGKLPPPDDGTMLAAFEVIAKTGKRCIVHAENLSVVTRAERLLREAGRTDGRAHPLSRPGVAAAEAVSRAIVFAEATGMRLHIAHESSANALPYIAAAKARGLDITVETCPQYLLFTAEDFDWLGGLLRCNTPVREAGHDAALWQAIDLGLIDAIATDHAPHPADKKTRNDIFDNACGLLGVETSLPLMLTEAHGGRLSIERLVGLMSAMPARIFDLWPSKGVIRPGADADIVLVDPDATWTIDRAALKSKDTTTAWHGRAVTGRVARTLVRGRTVFADGEVVGPPGYGREVRQDTAAPHPPARPPRPLPPDAIQTMLRMP